MSPRGRSQSIYTIYRHMITDARRQALRHGHTMGHALRTHHVDPVGKGAGSRGQVIFGYVGRSTCLHCGATFRVDTRTRETVGPAVNTSCYPA